MSSISSRKRSPHDFIFKQELGHGSYSTVYKAIDKTNAGRVYAIKVCSKAHIIKEGKVKYVTIEKNTLNLLARAQHPGIVRLHYTFHDEENLYFVLDYASGGELLSLLHKMGTFSVLWARHFTAQLIDAIEFIHSQGIIHRDLKPENLLLNKDGRLMITDFGTATSPLTNDEDASKSSCSSFVGTAEYVSPELLLHNQCQFSSDIWALGCMIYQFVQGVAPFRGENELQTFEKIVALDYPWNNISNIQPNKVDPLVVKLVRGILILDPTERTSLKDMKKDKWFEGVDWNNKELLWRGIWEIQQPVGYQLPQQRHHMMPNRQLHVIDTPIRNIPITKQKKKKPAKVSNTTSSIVEWRKKLGISSNDAIIIPNSKSSPSEHIPSIPTQQRPELPPQQISPTNGMIPPLLVNPQQLPRSQINATLPLVYAPPHSGSISVPVTTVNPQSAPSQLSSNTNVAVSPLGNQATPQGSKPFAIVNTNGNSSQQKYNSLVLKQDCVNIFEIPYRLNGPEMSLRSYNKIDNDIITELVLQHKTELRSPNQSTSPSVLTLFKDGTLSYKNGSSSRHIVNIGDTDLSMYDFEFYEKKSKGFLILEKYKYKIWFVSLPTKPFSAPPGPLINKLENWVDCFFRARQIIEDQKIVNKMKNVKLEDTLQNAANTSITHTITTAMHGKLKEPIDSNGKSAKQRVNSNNNSNNSSNSNVNNHNGRRHVSSPTMGHTSHRNSPRSPTLIPATSPVMSNSSTMKRYAAPNNMVISSSRYEVLSALKQSSGADIASSGASAAFKNLQKRKVNK